MRGYGKPRVGPLTVLLLIVPLTLSGCDGTPPQTPTLQPATASPALSTAAISPSPTATTAPATATPSAVPTQAATPTPSATATATSTPTSQPTPSPTIHTGPTPPPATPSGPVDFNLPPDHGSLTFDAATTADPVTLDLTVNVSLDASYLGDGCDVKVTAEPQVLVEFVGPSTTGLLRFYFQGSGDPALVIHTSAGAWLCNDDSYGGSSPTIDITDAPALQGSSEYDVWVGSYAGGRVIGTLYVTAIDSNHP